MKVLITGGHGFIGSCLAKNLAVRNFDVVILDNNVTQTNEIRMSKGINVVNDSILNRSLVEELLSDVSYCFHLAAVVGVKTINSAPIESLEVNLSGSQIVLNSAAKFGIRTIFASSSEIYGKNLDIPLNENSNRVLGSPQVARWVYSEAKAIAELLAFELHKNKSFPVTVTRFFNTVGPGQSSSYGMVLPRFIKAAISNQPLTVYGDGTQSRTFCSVTDVVDALVLLMDSKESIGQAFNIGSTNEITITELAQKVIKLTNSTSEIIYKKHSEVFGDHFEEPQRRVPDISKIKKVVGWQPKQSLDEIIIGIAEYLRG
jgi:UDP-glucose 4-epimerase